MSAPYYQDGHVTLWHGDCEQVLADEGACAHVVVTSPPYNMGLTPGGGGRGMYRPSLSRKAPKFRAGYDGHDDAMDQADYDAWQRRVIGLLWRAIPDDGAIYYNHKQRVEHGVARLPLGLDFGVPLRQIITWDRGTGIGVNVRHYCSTSEFVFLLARPGFKLSGHAASGAGDVWRIPMSRSEPDHPAVFPVGLAAKAIQTSGARSVLDPFAGTGTSLLAAKLLGIPAVGIEQSERYCELIATRLNRDVLDLAGVTP